MNWKRVSAMGSCLMASLHGQVVTNEVVSDNYLGDIKDRHGAHSDWIELHNQSAAAVSLLDYYLTDNSEQLTKWQFTEDFVIPPGGYAIGSDPPLTLTRDEA